MEDRQLLAANPIVLENQLPGNAQAEWDVVGIGDQSIQGFTTDISANVGQTINFKIDDVNVAPYRLDIYRMGYYGGLGARKVATIPSSQTLRVHQPAPLTNASTGLVDAGNWSVTASWPIPSTATSGIYFARVVREDTGGASRIVFVVRNDNSHSDLLFQTSDSTWQAYNDFGNQSLYQGNSTAAAGRAVKVSYNRPLTLDDQAGGLGSYNSPFHAEYPMVRWVEANGYDVSYFTNVDTDRFGAEIKEHKAFLSVGHDEYWSGQMRANVEAARDAGVNLAFFSGNEVFWKVRWENSTDASGTPYRTLVSYKESKDNAKTDPTPTWTGTWRDDRFSPPSDGGRPENALTGTLYMNDRTSVDIGIPMQVPAADGKLRFWRDTPVSQLAAGQVATIGDRVVGYETDEDVDNGFRPAGLIGMSSTTFNSLSHVTVPWGTVVGPGSSTHRITLYRAASGALVFGAGTVQWSWGLDGSHANGPSTTDPSMRQATVNLFADMGVQPQTLQAGLVPAIASSDAVDPSSSITWTPPAGGVTAGIPVTITGTASDVGGLVGGVEVSTDGGRTWHPAIGRGSWTYTWTPTTPGPVKVFSRASDDSLNLSQPSAPVNVTVKLPLTSATGLVAAYDFNDGTGTTLTNRATGAGNGTLSGPTWTTGGMFGSGALSFDGVNDWVTVPDSAAVDLTNGMTLEAWVRPNTISRYTTVLLKEGTGQLSYSLYASDGADRPPVSWIKATIGGDENATGTSNLALNAWSHLAVTSDGSDLILYVNGVAVDSEDVSSGLVTTNGVLRIGGNSIWGEYFGGLIDEVRVYNRALTSGEILSDMSTPIGGSVETTAPTGVVVTAPAAGASLSNTVTVSASATDNVVVAGVRFFLNGQPLGDEDTTAPYSVAWNTQKYVNGSYVLTAVARDAAGNTTTSGGVTVAVNNPADAAAPSLTVLVPTADTTLAGRLVLGAMAADNIGVVGVQFKLDGVNLGTEDTTAPYRVAYDFSTVASGAHTLTAVARDAAGNTTSYPVSVIVDSTPPAVIARTPAAGASTVSTNVDPTGTFSEDMTPASVVMVLRDLAGNVVPSTSTLYDPATRKVTLAHGTALLSSTTYTVTVESARDLAGNGLAAPVSWSFTTADAITGATIFGNALPANPDANDPNAVELGVEFRADVAGKVTGIRFYKGPGNTGTHVAHLWSASGALLATGTFSAETASGWQEVTFTTPVNISANTTYVASYFAPAGHYAVDGNYFASPRYSPPLKGTMGAFVYGGGFPTNASTSNYWVDVLFSTTLADTIAPTVTNTTPPANAAGVNTTAFVTATFSEPVVASSILFELRDGANNLVPVTVSYDAVSRTVTAVPTNGLTVSTNYSARVSGAADTAGNTMAPVSWAFSTTLPDTTAPTTTLVTPGPGQTQVAPKETISVAFNEPVKPSSITLRVLDVTHNEEMNANVLYNSTTNTATFNPVAPAGAPAGCCGQCTHCPLRTATEYRATLSGVQDLAGNVMPDMAWTFTTSDLITGASLWQNAATPAVESVTATGPVEVGVKFQTSQLGYITGLRFYKGAGNTGVHVGHLWDGSGLPLGSATFTNETASGWQQVNFSMPVLISPNKTYVASYYAPNGGYALTNSYFTAAGFSNGVLSAPASGQSGGNGVFFLGSGGAFPTQSSNDANYWVDVVYANTLATVVSYSPAPGSTVDVGANLTATFSLPAQPASIAFTVLGPNNAPVAGVVTYDAATNKATFDPVGDLATTTQYTVTVTAMDVYNNVSEPQTWSFTTNAGPDLIAPTVTGRTPASGATDVGRSSNVAVTFSEPVQAGTINLVLRDNLGNAVPATVTSDAATNTATLDPTAALAPTTTYTATVSGAMDAAGNPLAAPATWSFTTGTATIWADSATPAVVSATDTNAVELGVKFRSDVGGYVTGVRFYKGVANTGTHVGHLWTAAGGLLGTATFTDEGASGWQTATFSSPVPVTAGTTYVASYYAPLGRYAADTGYFAAVGFGDGPVRALANGADGGNGVFRYGSGGGFPNNSGGGSNYWVDVVFATKVIDNTVPTVTGTSPAAGATDVARTLPITATFSETVEPGSITFVLRDASNNVVAASASYDAATRTATLTPAAPLGISATYTATLSGAADAAGNVMAGASTWSFTTGAATLWSPAMGPATPAASDGSAVEVGLKFRSTLAGYVTGVRFYKGAGNTGTHVGHLWTASGTLLAEATFAGETAGGWQQVMFPNAVPIAANTTYVISYHAPAGHYAADAGYFTSSAFTTAPLRALAAGEDGANGVYGYGAAGTFPTSSFSSTNYWVAPVFDTSAADPVAPTVTSRTPAAGATAVPWTTAVAATFSEPVQPGTISFVLRDAANAAVDAQWVYNESAGTATLTPVAALSPASVYTATLSGAKDLVGNTMAAVTWSFTTAPIVPPTYSFWPDLTAPTVASVNDTAAVELGVKFRSDVNGVITGVRFYKGAGNTGTHLGHLWTADGTLLATVTFNGESGSGWQTAIFTAPVAVSAGTTYVASYYAPVGRYAVTGGYFATSGVNSGPIHALAAGVDGANGVYRYGTGGGFPTSSFNSSNYWVDVVFTPGGSSAPPPASWKQTTAADFDAGSANSVQITSVSGGELRLAAVETIDDFNGAALGSSWASTSWASAGGGPAAVTVAGGTLSVAGSQVLSEPVAPGGAVEGSVSFGATAYQHFGLATSVDAFAGNYWAMFSTGGTSNTLFARVNVSGAVNDVNLGVLPAGFHTYRVQPTAAGFDFLVDGVVKTSIAASFPSGTPLRAVLSAFSGAPAPALQAAWVKAGTFAPSGTFVSSVFDAGSTTTWGVMDWNATLPPGTSILVETSTSDSPSGGWSAWEAVADGGTVASPAGRYLRYRITLLTGSWGDTPTVFDITFTRG